MIKSNGNERQFSNVTTSEEQLSPAICPGANSNELLDLWDMQLKSAINLYPEIMGNDSPKPLISEEEVIDSVLIANKLKEISIENVRESNEKLKTNIHNSLAILAEEFPELADEIYTKLSEEDLSEEPQRILQFQQNGEQILNGLRPSLPTIPSMTPAALALIGMIGKDELLRIKISRRTFLQGAGLVSLVLLLASCDIDSTSEQTIPEAERIGIINGLSFAEFQNQVDSQGIQIAPELDRTIGYDWRKQVTEMLSDQATPINEENGDSTTAYFVSAMLAGNEAINQTMENGVRAVILGQGDPKIGQIAEMIGHLDNPSKLDPVLFYHERSKGGFVILDRNTKTWFKFFKYTGQPDTTILSGYHEQAIRLWQENSRLFNSAPSYRLNEISLKTTVIGGDPYVVYRTPHMGRETIEKLVNARLLSPQQGRAFVLRYYEESARHILNGHIYAATKDPNPGNIVLVNGHTAPIDFDGIPIAFQDEEVALRMFTDRVLKTYDGQKTPGLSKITEQELRNMISASPELAGKKLLESGDIKRVTITVPQKSGPPFKMRYYYRSTTGENKNIGAIKYQVEQFLANQGTLPEEMLIDGVSIKISPAPSKINGLNVSTRRLGFLKRLDQLRPYIRPASTAISVVATALIMEQMAKDIAYRERTPFLHIDKSADNAKKTENLVARTAKIGDVVNVIEHRINWISRQIMAQDGICPPGYEDLCAGVKRLEETTGIPLTTKGITDRGVENSIDNIENESILIQMRLDVERRIAEIIKESGIWNNIDIEGMSPVPLTLSNREASHNMALRYETRPNGQVVLTFGIFVNNGHDVEPIFDITYDRNTRTVVNVSSLTAEKIIKVQYNNGYSNSSGEALDPQPFDEIQFNLQDPNHKLDLINKINERGLELFLRLDNQT